MAATAGYGSQVLIGSLPSVAFTDEATTTSDLTTYTISNALKRYLDKSVPTVVQTSPDGSTWTTVTTGFTLYRAGGRVVFASAQPSGTQVRLHSGNYIPYAVLAEATSCDFAGKMNMVDATVFNQSYYSYLPTMLSATMKVGTLWMSNARATSLKARDLIIGSFLLPSGNRYEGFCYASDLDIKGDPKNLIVQDITFQLTDEFFNA